MGGPPKQLKRNLNLPLLRRGAAKATRGKTDAFIVNRGVLRGRPQYRDFSVSFGDERKATFSVLFGVVFGWQKVACQK